MGNTERRVKNLMSKMSGGDLGKLFMKDVIAELGGDSRAYSPEDFDAVFKKLDWHNQNEYARYRDLLRVIISQFLYGWWLCSAIEATTLRFDAVLWIMRFNQTYGMAAESLLSQRLEYGLSDGEWRDPGDEEKLLREKSKQLMEAFLENREGIARLRDTLMSRVRQYLTFDKIMRSLAEVVGIPELATIVESPLHHAEELSQDIESELESLPVDSQYREALPEIDISILEADEAGVESFISKTTELLKA